MRSIGKVKIKKLKAIVREEWNKTPFFDRGGPAMKQAINERIPSEWYDTWESAWSEIERLISDEIMRLCHCND